MSDATLLTRPPHATTIPKLLMNGTPGHPSQLHAIPPILILLATTNLSLSLDGNLSHNGMTGAHLPKQKEHVTMMILNHHATFLRPKLATLAVLKTDAGTTNPLLVIAPTPSPCATKCQLLKISLAISMTLDLLATHQDGKKTLSSSSASLETPVRLATCLLLSQDAHLSRLCLKHLPANTSLLELKGVTADGDVIP